MCVCWPNLQGTSKNNCVVVCSNTNKNSPVARFYSFPVKRRVGVTAAMDRHCLARNFLFPCFFFFFTSRCLCTRCLHGCATKLITMYPCFGWVCPPCSIWVKGILLRFQMLLAASLTRCVWLLRLASTNFVGFLQPVTSLHQQSRSSCYVLIRACWTVASCFMQNVIF